MAYKLRTNQTWTQTIGDLRIMFGRWKISAWAVWPAKEPKWGEGDEVSIRFVKDGEQREFTYSKLERPVDNLRALYLGLDSMRLNELRGIGDIVREMYIGLPAPKYERDPHEVLGLRPDAPLELVEASYRTLAKKLHPDVQGGDAEAFKELDAAYQKLKAGS